MNVVLLAYGNESIGLGHYYRTLALAQEASCRGHRAVFLSDKTTCQPGVRWERVDRDDMYSVLRRTADIRPDWVVADLPGEAPAWFRGGWRLLLLDPPDPYEPDCDLAVSQGFLGEHAAPEHVILAPELTAIKRPVRRERCWFVWGGAADGMGLLEMFAKHTSFTGLLASVEGATPVVETWNPVHWQAWAGSRSEFFRWMSECDRALVQAGQAAWECLYLGLPLWLVSGSGRSLETALEMQRRDWARAWPVAGLPPGGMRRAGGTLVDWLSMKWRPEPCPVDGKGAERIVKLMDHI